MNLTTQEMLCKIIEVDINTYEFLKNLPEIKNYNTWIKEVKVKTYANTYTYIAMGFDSQREFYRLLRFSRSRNWYLYGGSDYFVKILPHGVTTDQLAELISLAKSLDIQDIIAFI